MRNMLQVLRHRLDQANAHRTLENPLTPMVHAIFKGTRPDGDPEFCHRAVVISIGEDYIEIQGQGMIDRGEIRSIQPINF